MLIGTIITYNDYPLIKECIDSIYSKVDRIVIVDGKFWDFPDNGDYSSGESLEYLLKLSGDDKFEIILAGGLTEVEKRNVYLRDLKEGDTVLNLDADEVLIGNIPTLESDFGIIELYDGHLRHIQRRATRFFKFREGIKYENVHYTLYWNGKIINRLHEVINSDFTSEHIKDFYLLHKWHLRSEERKYDKSIYYKKLLKTEAGYKR